MKYNRKNVSKKTVNLAGGKAHAQSLKLELASILLTSFLKDQAYRKGDETSERIQKLVADIPDKKFAAKAALFARNEYGMRSVSHLVAAEIAKLVKGEEWSKTFFERIVRRPDDLREILACYMGQYGKPIPNAMKKGFAAALEEMDAYDLAKYKGEGTEISMVDAVNLLHPKSNKSLKALMKGTLKAAETWEAKLSKAGQVAESEKELSKLKATAWKELISERKLGYFALLRNLRNIEEQAPKLIPAACEMLTDKGLIKKSLVLPFRFTTALKELGHNREYVMAINKAMEIALENVPTFSGKTLIALDASGSMQNGGTTQTPLEIASLFASVLFKKNDADILVFGTKAGFANLNPNDSIGTLTAMLSSADFGGTDFNLIFTSARKKYDRIIILSDMQAWVGYHTPKSSFEAYKAKYKANPTIFSFDLAGYGTMQFPENQVYCLAGFSEKTLDVLKMLEEDRNALINKIEAVEL